MVRWEVQRTSGVSVRELRRQFQSRTRALLRGSRPAPNIKSKITSFASAQEVRPVVMTLSVAFPVGGV